MSERLKLGVGSMMAGTRVSGVSGYESVYSKVHGLPHDKQADIRTVDGRWQIRQPALDWHGDYGTEQEALKAVAVEFEGPDRPGAYALGTKDNRGLSCQSVPEEIEALLQVAFQTARARNGEFEAVIVRGAGRSSCSLTVHVADPDRVFRAIPLSQVSTLKDFDLIVDQLFSVEV